MGNVIIMDHPLIKHKIGLIRDKSTGTKDFETEKKTNHDLHENQKILEKLAGQGQLLHAYRLVFPEMTGKLSYLSGKEIICEL